MKRKLFIFGGFGFIGLNLNIYLCKDYHITLIGKNTRNHRPKNCEKIISDIYDLQSLKGIKFEKSIIILPILSLKKDRDTFKKKFEGLINLLLSKNPERIVLLSSVSVYGSSKKVLNEKSNIKVNSEYGKFCKISEKICLKSKSKKIVILRISNLFGPFRDRPSFIEKIILNYLFKKKYKLNNKSLIRSYLSINEFSKIIKRIVSSNFKQKIYNISNPNNIRNSKHVINFFEKKLKTKINCFDRQEVVIKNSIISSKLFEKDYKFKFENKFENDLMSLVKLYKLLK